MPTRLDTNLREIAKLGDRVCQRITRHNLEMKDIVKLPAS